MNNEQFKKDMTDLVEGDLLSQIVIHMMETCVDEFNKKYPKAEVPPEKSLLVGSLLMNRKLMEISKDMTESIIGMGNDSLAGKQEKDYVCAMLSGWRQSKVFPYIVIFNAFPEASDDELYDIARSYEAQMVSGVN